MTWDRSSTSGPLPPGDIADEGENIELLEARRQDTARLLREAADQVLAGQPPSPEALDKVVAWTLELRRIRDLVRERPDCDLSQLREIADLTHRLRELGLGGERRSTPPPQPTHGPPDVGSRRASAAPTPAPKVHDQATLGLKQPTRAVPPSAPNIPPAPARQETPTSGDPVAAAHPSTFTPAPEVPEQEVIVRAGSIPRNPAAEPVPGPGPGLKPGPDLEDGLVARTVWQTSSRPAPSHPTSARRSKDAADDDAPGGRRRPKTAERPLVPPLPPVPARTLPENAWTGDKPSLVATLIAAGDDALAYHVATSQGTATTAQLMELFCSAFNCPAVATERLLINWEGPSEQSEMDVEHTRVALAGLLRAGLELGFAPVPLSTLIEGARISDERLLDLVETVRMRINQNRRLVPTTTPVHDLGTLSGLWRDAHDHAEALRDNLGKRSTSYARASKILNRFPWSDEMVGRALESAIALSASRPTDAMQDRDAWVDLADRAEQLMDEAERERVIADIDRAISSPQQLKKPLVASAAKALHGALIEVAEVLTRLVGLRRDMLSVSDDKNAALAGELKGLAGAIERSVPPLTPGEAALGRLVSWLGAADGGRGETRSWRASVGVSGFLDGCLLGAPGIPRDVGGRPSRVPDRHDLEYLLAAEDPLIVARRLASKGDIGAATEFLLLHGRLDDSARQELGGLRAAAVAEHHRLTDQIDVVVARLRALYRDDSARAIARARAALADVVEDRLDLTVPALRDLLVQGENELAVARASLHARVDEIEAEHPDDAARIRRTLEQDGEEVLAPDYLALVEAGQKLPSIEAPSGDDFGEFFPAFVNVAAAGSQSLDQIIRRGEAIAGRKSRDTTMETGAAEWGLIQSKRVLRDQNTSFVRAIAGVLRMCGLLTDQGAFHQLGRTAPRSGYQQFSISANNARADRSYVPAFGSQAGRYNVTIIWDVMTPQRILQTVTNKDEPNIILYLQTMSVAHRLDLRRLTAPGRGYEFSVLLIDNAVAAWLATREEPAWRVTQRVTLPFTTLNPYTPFAGGAVPPEMFVGRSTERAKLVDRHASIFAYGGRQLGKSALLRSIEREFTEDFERRDVAYPRSGPIAVYLDLKAASIGEALMPSELWPRLGQKLQDVRVLDARKPATTYEMVRNGILKWVAADDSNRLLVLLDEADDFMSADAKKDVENAVFPVVLQLRSLMDDTQRSFKVVIAGLHQVARFHNLPNTPVAHGGEDILVGSLTPVDARALVRDPLFALGYEFESQETLWRLLLLTNYQASLIQIFCDALVRHLQPRAMPAEGGRALITMADVHEVYAKPDVQRLIVTRFRWTVNLDNRYQVIALVTALLTMDASPGTLFSSETLREWCTAYWESGFASADDDFDRYIDEMCGLGVLHRGPEGIGLRSPNIIGLLGDRQELQETLERAEKELEVDYEYDGAKNRRILGESEDGSRRSPLSDKDLARIVPLDTSRAGLSIVVGSEALGLADVADAITMTVEHMASPPEIVPLTPTVLGAALQSSPAKRRHVIVAADHGSLADELAILRDRIDRSPLLSATVIVGPETTLRRHDLRDDEIWIGLRRWSLEGLRSVGDSLFSTKSLRKELFDATSGWPCLVSEALATAASSTAQDALAAIAGLLEDAGRAGEFLAKTGIPLDVVGPWALAVGVWERDGNVLKDVQSLNVEGVQAALGVDGPVDDLLATLAMLGAVTEDHGEWLLDRVIVRAAHALER